MNLLLIASAVIPREHGYRFTRDDENTAIGLLEMMRTRLSVYSR